MIELMSAKTGTVLALPSELELMLALHWKYSTVLPLFTPLITVLVTSRIRLLYCLSDSNLLAVEWYTNNNPNRSMEATYPSRFEVSTRQPHVSNPRVGRSNLIVSTCYLPTYEVISIVEII